MTGYPIASQRGFAEGVIHGAFWSPLHPELRIPWAALEEYGADWERTLESASLPSNEDNDNDRQQRIYELLGVAADHWHEIAQRFAPAADTDADRDAMQSEARDVFRDFRIIDYSDEKTNEALQLSPEEAQSLKSAPLDALPLSKSAVSGLMYRFEQLSLPLQILIVLVLVYLVRKVMA